MVPGLYHWITAGNGAAQARFFHGLVVEAGGPRGMIIALDCEDDAAYSDVVAWRDEWRRLSGGHPFLLYTGGWWWRPRGWNGTAITPYLWDSHYLTADTDTIQDDPAAFAARIPADWWTPGYGGWPAATILQFTSRGDAGSLGNNVDLNATKLSRDQLLALTGDDMPTKEEFWTWLKSMPIAGTSGPGGNPGRTFEQAFTDVWGNSHIRDTQQWTAVNAKLDRLATEVNIDPAELAAIGAEAAAAVDEQAIADRVLAGLGTKSPEDVAAALRAVMTPEQARAVGALLAAALDEA
jgi:hypothetical protein